MVKEQCCKMCRSSYDIDSAQRDYTNFKQFGFKNEDDFKKHSRRNKRCPSKNNTANIDFLENEVPIWPQYQNNTNFTTQDDYEAEQEIMNIREKKHNKGGRQLWYDTTEIAAMHIIDEISKDDIQWISLVAQPGSGKTMVIHFLIYLINKLQYESSISTDSITLTTGMSDTEWYDQVLQNFRLRDGNYLWNSIYKIENNNCIVHRSNFHKRITYILNNLKYISNHIFIIDESHFADDPDMTIDTELKRLGLTKERMKEYKIKVIFVSATPDVTLSLMTRNENHKQIKLINGYNYKGFKFFNDNEMILDYNSNNNIEQIIRSRWTKPRYHFIRARTQQEKGEYRKRLMDMCTDNAWIYYEDDSDTNSYISFKNDENEINAVNKNKLIIKTYVEPLFHTFILIKNKYQASKRLKLTEYTGLITEKPAKKINTTVTCNGLIPRFFGYDNLPEFNNNELPLFLCCKKSVEEYIKFTEIADDEEWIYNGKDYTGSRIVSSERKTKELRNTWVGKLSNINLENRLNDIKVHETPFNTIYDVNKFISDIFNITSSISEFYKPNKDVPYELTTRLTNYYNKKKAELTIDDRLTMEKYKELQISNSGINISSSGSGQPYMVYPVYDNMESLTTETKYYVHYLKMY
jgi:hypothetical protein